MDVPRSLSIHVDTITPESVARACNDLLQAHGCGPDALVTRASLIDALDLLADVVADSRGSLPLRTAVAFDRLNRALGEPFLSTEDHVLVDRVRHARRRRSPRNHGEGSSPGDHGSLDGSQKR